MAIPAGEMSGGGCLCQPDDHDPRPDLVCAIRFDRSGLAEYVFLLRQQPLAVRRHSRVWTAADRVPEPDVGGGGDLAAADGADDHDLDDVVFLLSAFGHYLGGWV